MSANWAFWDSAEWKDFARRSFPFMSAEEAELCMMERICAEPTGEEVRWALDRQKRRASRLGKEAKKRQTVTRLAEDAQLDRRIAELKRRRKAMSPRSSR